MKSQKAVVAIAAVTALLFGSELYLYQQCEALSVENTELRETVATMDATILGMREESDQISQDADRVKSENVDLKVKVNQLDQQVDDLALAMAQAKNTIIELSGAIDESQFTEPKVEEPEVTIRALNTDPDNITEVSGMTGEQFDELISKIMSTRGLDSCRLAGTGAAFAEVEDTYGINGVYILAIFAHESAFATKCINTNNFGGIRSGSSSWKYFETPSDCIYYEGRLLKDKYVDCGLIELDDIGDKYCEGDAWPDRIQELVDEFIGYTKEVVTD